MTTLACPLAQYLHPLLSKRLVNASSYWRDRLEQHQSFGGDAVGAVLEAQWWINRIEELINHLSPTQIEAMIKEFPEREKWVMIGRSQGRIYKDMARELGVTVGLIKTLYGRGLKRCTSYLLDSIRPDPSALGSYIHQGHTLAVVGEIVQGGGATDPLWQATEAVLRHRLGKGTMVVLGRLQAEFGQTDPVHLQQQLEHWLKGHFSQIAAAEFVALLEADTSRGSP